MGTVLVIGHTGMDLHSPPPTGFSDQKTMGTLLRLGLGRCALTARRSGRIYELHRPRNLLLHEQSSTPL